MSASEKLKALAAREQWGSHDATVLAGLALTLEDALPQIVALAKAAELVVGTQPRGDFDIHTLHQALEDLDEALSA